MAGTFLTLAILERRRPLRRSVEPALQRTGRNLAIAALGAVAIHHSNLELPLAIERRLGRVFVTPRMHGIHHSYVHDETDSNWSSGLTMWDWLHGTLKLNVPQSEITIGVPAFRDPNEVTLPKMVALPFEPQRPYWVLPDDGEPMRSGSAARPTQLLP